MKPITNTKPIRSLPTGTVFIPVSAHAWVATDDGRVVAVRREDYTDEEFQTLFKEA